MVVRTNIQRDQPTLPMQGIPQPPREEVLDLPRLSISRHPVIAHKLTTLRDKQTPSPEFYRLVKEIGSLLAYEVTHHWHLKQVELILRTRRSFE